MFLDIASGIFVALFLDWRFGLPFSLNFIFGCIVFALLPDMDYLFHLLKGGTSKNDDRHREAVHYPLYYIPAGMLALWFYDPIWTLAFGLGSFLHFLHDSIGIGWGIQWLYPFTKDHYTFFYHYETPNKPKLPQHLVNVWPHEKMDGLIKEYGDPDWIRNIYYHLHPFALIEFGAFFAALIALLVALR